MDILEQYGLVSHKMVRGRGGFICETDKGYKLLKETASDEEKLAKVAFVTNSLEEAGYRKTDVFEVSCKGTLTVQDEEGKSYYLKRWYEYDECDVKNYGRVLEAVGEIACLGNNLNKIDYTVNNNFKIPVSLEINRRYAKKIKEMRAVANYLRKKRNKNAFERSAYEVMEGFMKEAQIALDKAELLTDDESLYGLVHGACNHHNILCGKNGCAIVGFERAKIDVKIMDLYDFMRKILEKYDWDIKLAYKMLDEYNKVKTLDENDINCLICLFTFPEKFFKIMNHYFNSSKVWIADKDVEKLIKAVAQNETRHRFLESLK